MNCPVDGTTLVMSDRSGIEIDYCPQCRGVWLDRGELDKIIEREQQLGYGADPRGAQQGQSSGGLGGLAGLLGGLSGGHGGRDRYDDHDR
ncbi:TFIIB-type zinc ribbon-containing protein, partial [Pseudolysinimonas sp.]